ncbi:MAG: tetratricopeptide repeat protein, partial [Pseudomonadota bacterium]
KAAEKRIKDEKERVPFITMRGKALLEQGKFKESREYYLQAIKIDPAAKDLSESKFNLARCFMHLKDVEAAKKGWQEVVASKDEFWSPLAANELKLLEKP